MKKAILILVLGLLLTGCATPNQPETKQFREDDPRILEANGRIYTGMAKNDFCWVRSNSWYAIFCFKFIGAKPPGYYFRQGNYEILGTEAGRYYVFKNVTKPVITQFRTGDGVLASMHDSMIKAKESIGIKIVKKTEPKKTEPKKTEPKKKKPKKETPDDNKVVAAASGTGFFVSRTGHVVTNHHVIDECKAVKVNFKGDEIEAKILAIDKTNDLAILKANINPGKVFAVSNKDVSLLQDIIVAGFPLGKRVSAAIKTHKGSVSALAGFGDNYSNFQTDATINQGNSGGPVMDQKGNIVGVAVALMSVEAGQNIFFAVKSSTLKTFANSNGITFLPPNNREMSNAELGQLITEGTLFLECWMTIAKIKQIIAQEENRKAFYSEHK